MRETTERFTSYPPPSGGRLVREQKAVTEQSAQPAEALPKAMPEAEYLDLMGIHDDEMGGYRCTDCLLNYSTREEAEHCQRPPRAETAINLELLQHVWLYLERPKATDRRGGLPGEIYPA